MRDRSAETAVRCASLLFSRRAGKDCGLPAGDPPPFSFAGGKRKRPRPVKRKPLGRKGGPNGPPFRERGGRANRSGGRRRPRRPCARPVPQGAASPHNYCGGRMGGTRGNWRISTPARSASLRAAGLFEGAANGCLLPERALAWHRPKGFPQGKRRRSCVRAELKDRYCVRLCNTSSTATGAARSGADRAEREAETNTSNTPSIHARLLCGD